MTFPLTNVHPRKYLAHGFRELDAKQRDHRNDAVNQDAEHQIARDVYFARRLPDEKAQRLVTVRAKEDKQGHDDRGQDRHPTEQQQRFARLERIRNGREQHQQQPHCDQPYQILQVREDVLQESHSVRDQEKLPFIPPRGVDWRAARRPPRIFEQATDSLGQLRQRGLRITALPQGILPVAFRVGPERKRQFAFGLFDQLSDPLSLLGLPRPEFQRVIKRPGLPP